MIKLLVKHNLSNAAYVVVGTAAFFFSFHIGESSLIGGLVHLSGCALFCTGIHGFHDVKMEAEIHPHGHH